LAAARGRVDFTHKGSASSAPAPGVYGGEAAIDGGSQPDGTLRFTVSGQASADGLRRRTELGPR